MKKHSWPTSQINRSSKKKKNIKKLLQKLDTAAANDKDKSEQIRELKSDIIDLTGENC